MSRSAEADGEARPDAGPGLRSFGLNSREFYEAVTEPPDPWVWAGGLPREPRLRNLPTIIEHGTRAKC